MAPAAAITEAELVALHAPEIRAMARGLGWYLPGAEREDLEQEALIGLLLACRAYRPGVGTFAGFARMCARRRVTSVLKDANRHKQRPLTHAIRRLVTDEGREIPLAEALADPRADIEARVADREALGAVLLACEGFSQLERQAVFGVAAGYSYAEIDGAPGGFKRVDNAMQRGRQKLREAIAA